MNNPSLFRHTNIASRMARVKFLEDFKSRINWRDDGEDSLLDIGCAGGDITTENIQNIMPKTFTRLVGVDINENMVNYANKTFGNSKISFAVLDIGSDISKFLDENPPFDHVTSLNCLHLVPDQELAIQNIYNLLTPDGNCLLYTIVESPNFRVYKKMIEQWKEYMNDAEHFVSFYYQRMNPMWVMEKMLRNAGFKQYSVDLRTSNFTYENMEEFENTCKAIIPFYPRIPTEKQSEFMKQFIDNIMEFVKIEGSKITITCKHLLVYASKPIVKPKNKN